MIKFISLLSLALLILCQNQSISVTKSFICDCEDILNEVECNQKDGCEWSNSFISTSIGLQSSNKCTIKQKYSLKSYCNGIKLQIDCASSRGCAFYNNICQIFSGCSAYVRQTNKDCQLVSNQCTTNNLHCIDIRQCQFYETQFQCENNVALSGVKSCKWLDSKCVDKECSDYQFKKPNQQQCQDWIQHCFSTGQECVAQLQNCNKYNFIDGCDGWIGIEGNCTKDIQSQLCRPIQCQDAPTSFKTDQECNLFLSGCLTMGQGCVNQLASCITYKIQQGCNLLIGYDGYCTDDQQSENQSCRVKTCEEAPLFLNTDQLCRQFQLNCITNGQGCSYLLPKCSSYQGTQDKCSKYIGSEGDCYGNSSEIQEFCIVRDCSNAPNTFNTNQQCEQFKKGCITNGYGCVSNLLECSQYKVDTDLCDRLLGSDGKCYFNSNMGQNCVPKQCKDASKSYRTNLQCQEYSFTCVTNGYGCIRIQQCEITEHPSQCQGNNSCALINKCIDKRQCLNYLTKSECYLNKQDYKTSKGEIYKRNCIWSNDKCNNQQCNNYIGDSDFRCSQLLSGCLTDGQKCIDMEANCTEYYGNYEQCIKFNGKNGIQQCTQEKQDLNYSANCIIKTCEIAKQIFNNIDSDQKCSQFMSGCYFNGLNNCTNGDCTTYYGSLESCSQIQTVFLNGNQQQCGKIDQFDQISACSQKQFINCHQINPPQGTDEEKLKYCQQIKINNQINKCGYKALGINCSNKSCNDYGLSNANICKSYLFSCEFHTHLHFCYEISDNCINYIIPNIFQDYIAKQTYCSELVLASKEFCFYDIETQESCQNQKQYCSEYNLEQLISDQQKYEFCEKYQNEKGSKCLYNKSNNQCLDSFCLDYYQIDQDLLNQNQQKCQFNEVNDVFTCCQPPQMSCSDYKVYGNDVQTNKVLCQKLYTSTAPSVQCDYGTSGSVCQDFVCNSIYICSQNKCENVKIPIEISAISEKQFYCQQYTNLQKINCNQQNSQYFCDTAQYCTDYLAKGNSIQEKVQYCQSLTQEDQITCGYQSGLYCISCNQITTPDDSNQNKQQYCSQQTINQQQICGYIPGQSSCQLKQSCNDFGLISPQICKNYLSTCDFNSFSNECYEKQENCSKYQIPEIYNTYIMKAQYCQQQLVVDSQLYCIYTLQNQNICSPATSCMLDIGPFKSDYLKSEYCSLITTSSHSKCVYQINSSYWVCTDHRQCNELQIYYLDTLKNSVENINFYAQKYCQLSKDPEGLACNYFQDFNCSPPQQNCQNYKVFGEDAETNKQLCQNLYTNSIPSIQCDYGTDGQFCQNFDYTNQIGTQNFSKTSSCQINIIPQAITDPIIKGQFCQLYRNKFYANCSLKQGENKCSDSYLCSDFVTNGSNLNEKQKYCQVLRASNQISCIYLSGIYCISCFQIDVPQQFSILDSRLQYCLTITKSFLQYCSYQSGSNYCKDRKCDDLNLTTAQTCQNYMPQCFFNRFASLCYEKQLICQRYKIPIQFTTTLEKNQYCSGQYIYGSKVSCIYNIESINNCSEPIFFKYCETSNLDTIQDSLQRSQFCRMIKNEYNQSCAYDGQKCVSLNNCNNYNSNNSSDLQAQFQCQNNLDRNGFNCNYKQGESTCQPPQMNCSDYKVYGNDVQTNKVLCQKLYSSTTPSVQCDYGTSGTVCQNFVCASNQFCQQNKCENVKIPIDISTISEKQFYCQQYTNMQNINCNLQNSQYFCDTAQYCTDYLAKGNSIQDKAQYCQSLTQEDQITCGYQSGLYCISCNQITTPDDSNQNKQQYCSQQTINQLQICGFIPGQSNCSLKQSCDDFGLITPQICKNYLSKCDFNSFTNKCYKKQENCSKYQIPEIYNTYILKAQYCQQQLVVDSSLYCIYNLQNQNICSPASSCMVDIGPFQTNFAKSEYCGLIKTSSDSKCVYYDHINVYQCSDQEQCDKIRISSDIFTQKECQYSKDTLGFTCNYYSGNFCSPPQQNCQNYKVFGEDIDTNKQLCQNLYTNSIPSIQCDYGTEGQFCQNFDYTNYIGTQNFSKTSSCQINIIPQAITDPIIKAQFCQLFRNNFYANCSLKLGENACSESYLCSDFVTNGSNLNEKQKYCQALRASNQISCIYVSGEYCISCSQIDVPSQLTTYDQRIQYCLSSINLFLQYFSYDGSNHCRDRKCEDFNIYYIRTCQFQMPQCSFNKFASLCYEKQLRCQLYKIPQDYKTNLQKAQYCSGQNIYGSPIQCAFNEVMQTNCYEPQICSRVNFGQITDNLQRSVYCRLLRSEKNQICVYNGINQQCAYLLLCNYYQVAQNQNLQSQLQCQNNLDRNGFNCNYKQGESTCQPPQMNCSDYSVYGDEVSTNKELCQKLYTSTAPSVQCDYGTSGSVCQNFVCASNQFCQQNKCENVKIPIDISTISEKKFYCQQYTNMQKINCNLQNSQYFCDTAQYCTDYLAKGNSMQEKVQYCQSLTQEALITCGYQSGLYCISCNQITTPDDSNQNKQQYCSQQTINQQYICGYIPGQSNCSLKPYCSYFGQISPQICKNYLSTCDFNSYQNFCYEKQENCSNYLIPEIFNTYIMKALYCQQQYALNQQLACRYDNYSNFCSTANDCIINIYPLVNHHQKAEYCQIVKDKNNKNCSYHPSNVFNCNYRQQCDSYGTSSVYDPHPLNQLYVQQLCQFSIDTLGFNCNYEGGQNCSPPQQNCKNYKVFGEDIETNKQLCQNLYTNSSPSIQCDYGIDGQFCQNFDYTNYIGTQNFSKTSACSINIIPSAITDPIIKGQFCQLFRNNFYANCSLQQGKNACTDSYLCSDFVTNGSNFNDKLKYCQALRASNQISCIYVSGEYCFSCSQIDVLQQLSTLDLKFQYCQTITNTYLQYCSYHYGFHNCTDRQCDDQNLTTAQTCQNYMPQCSFNRVASLCYEKQLRCQLYKIPSKYSTTLQKTQYCSGQYTFRSRISCVFDTDLQNNCSEPIITMHIQEIYDEIEKSLYCRLIRTEQNKIQVYNGISQQCAFLSLCNDYQVAQNQNLQSQLQCQNNLDRNGFNCNYKQGESNCQPPQMNCSDYQVYGNDISANKDLCQKLYTSTSVQCDYGTSGTVCQDFVCKQNSCFVMGMCQQIENKCIDKLELCSLYQGNSQSYCSQLQQIDKQYCGWTSGQYCSIRNCEQMVNSESKVRCRYYLEECQFNGQGCVSKKQNCSQYQIYGDDDNKNSICNNLVNLNGIKCTYIGQNLCIERQQCNQYLISIEQQNQFQICQQLLDINNFSCVWKSGNSCSPNCTSAPTTYNTDYLCNQYSEGCITNGNGCEEPYSILCDQAPNSFISDAQCKTIHNNCVSNGFGCISTKNLRCQDIISMKTCTEYKNDFGCDIAKSCKTKEFKCQDMTNVSECVNSPLIGQTIANCAWDALKGQCSEIQCHLLPSTLTTHQGCNKYLQTCTTTGAGCITFGSCSSYYKYACNNALSTDAQQRCKWENQKCRPIICSDNQIAQSDFECNKYLNGCKTTGFGCSNYFKCAIFTQSQYCLQDSSNYPCIWFNSQCINYQKCEDYSGKTDSECQLLSNSCVTNGSYCIAITQCSQTILQISCVTGTDGNCGWQYSQNQIQQCAVFSICQDSFGQTLHQCQKWGIDCVTNGMNCINKQLCQLYTNESACNQGLDGKCIWIPQMLNCRLQQCEDNIISNREDCYALQLSTKCTTNGENCVQIKACQQYTTKVSCSIGTDGQCIWANQCRAIQCEDYEFHNSDKCQNLGNKNIKCVSDGKNCIQQQICSAYTTKESCLGGGIDGRCAFNSMNITNQVSCVKFSQCSDANQDEITCNTRQDSCYFNKTIINSTIISQCQNHTCLTKQKGSICQPIASFDLQTLQICVLHGLNCINDIPSNLDSENCYNYTKGTYTWNSKNKKCTVCKNNNNNNNLTDPDQQIKINELQLINIFIIILTF